MRNPIPSHLFQKTLLGLVVAAAGATALVPPTFAAAAQVKLQAPGYYRVMLGDFEITALSDGTIDLPVDKLLRGSAQRISADLQRSHLRNPVETSVTAFLINTGPKLVLIDAGAGTLFGPTLGKLLANLRAAGYTPEQVDEVLLTHIHPDHVGGLSSDGKATFTNATIHVDRRDADYWLSQVNLDKAPAESKGFFQGAQVSLKPYSSAGRLKTFDGSGDILPGIRAESSYGHTVGHTSYRIESQGQQLVVMGDLIHVAAVQLGSPQVTIAYDTDEKQAVGARSKIFKEVATDGALVGAAHLSFPGLGRLQEHGASWEWAPINYTTEFGSAK